MKNQKGITLVALVITIIVMLILAGVSISMVAGENGVLTRSESAVEKSRAGEIEEALRLAVTENQMMKYAGQTPLTQAQILARLQTEGKLTAEEVAEVTENGKLTIGTTEIDFTIIEGNSNEPEEVSIITFSLAGKEFQAEEGMTWTEFLDSEYNIDENGSSPFRVNTMNGEPVLGYSGTYVIYQYESGNFTSDKFIPLSDTIRANYEYYQFAI